MMTCKKQEPPAWAAPVKWFFCQDYYLSMTMRRAGQSPTFTK